ncbi:MAG: LamG-like jellyroll fold domain-containing protein [bacterium]|nr:LamG-like jellyroll fold domain-containing protein [bacterium]
MYYNNTAAVDGQTATGVWDSNYKGVWHLPNGTTLSANDSTTNAINGTVTGATAAAGQIDGVASFNGVGNYISMPLTKTSIGSMPTISMWIRPTGAQSTIGIFQVADGLSSQGPWILIQRNSPTSVRWYLNSNWRITQYINDDTYYHITLSYDGTTWRAYKNGVADGTYVGTLGFDNGGTTWLGNGYNGYFNGLFDEVRISNTPRSAAWIAASYKSETDAFNTFGSEESGNSAPNTPTNVTPTNGLTGQNLNVSLTGSAYSDPESNPQTDASWQVDDDADFATPVWTRTAGAAETTTAVTGANGTFANELVGKTELDHNTTYYWQVRYSDGTSWSSYSVSTTFVTNIISTPTNSSPADLATLTTLTPLLEASVFSDAQPGHTHSASQWLVDDNSDFSSLTYDSGETVSAETSRAVPGGVLANYTTYYWKVRYKDSSSLWSAYSASTQFATQISETAVEVRPVFGNTTVDQGDAVKIDVQVINFTDGSPLNNATSTINIYNPSGSKIVDVASMIYVSGSNGIYRYSYTVPSTSGSYLYDVTATQGNKSGYGAANFEVRTIQSDVSNISSDIAVHEASQAAERASQAAERASQAAERAAQTAERTTQTTERTSQTAERTSQEVERTAQTTERASSTAERTAQTDSRTKVEDIQTKTTDIQTKVTDVQTKVTNIQSNMDILIGAMIVTQSTVNDASASTTSFITALTNATNDFYKNAILTFTSGNLNGQVRRISGYNGASKAITLDPALTSAPANGDAFTIVKQNVYVEQQVAEHETAQAVERTAQASFRTDTTSRLTSIESKIDTITANLNTVDTNLDSVLSTVNSIRTSQQKGYKVELSDVSEIQAGNTYRAKLTILDFESNPVDATSTPTILIYDATRAVAQATTPMTKLSTGVYEYTSAISSSATAGLWETIVNVDVGGTANIVRNDYWQVTGAPAQVVINSMSDLTVPSIAANTTITNEGGGAYEYQYEWCVVSSQENQCGGSDDVYYASAAKLISAGDSFNPTLTATVSATGDYWFKVVVYYGTEASGASRTFTATTEAATTPAPSSSGGGGGGSSLATHENIYSEIVKARNQLELQAQKLARTLEILGAVSPSLQALLQVNNLNTENLIDIQNKVADLRAVSAATRRIVEQKTVEPIVETYMKFNSVEIHFLITNPDAKQQTVKFKAFLPEEAKPEHILDLSGLKVDYDTNAKVYYVSGDITLGSKETVTRKVEMKDIWVFAPEEINSIKDQANGLIPILAKTQYEAQGAILKNDIDSTLNIVLLRQEESYASPQDHIVVYRENKERMTRAENNLEKLKDLVVQAGASRGVVGQVGGIQTFATWGIILAIVFGFGLLAAVIFAMWRHQTMLAAVAMGMNKDEAMAQFGVARRRRKLLKKNRLPETQPRSVRVSFIWNLPWKKILIWFVIVGIAVVIGFLTIRFAPGLFDSRETKFINEEASTVGQTTPQEKSIGSQLVPETKDNVEIIFSNSEDSKKNETGSGLISPKLTITNTPTGWLNVRADASLDGKSIGKVYPGDVYEYTDEKDGWYKIILEDKTDGWIFGSYTEKIKN